MSSFEVKLLPRKSPGIPPVAPVRRHALDAKHAGVPGRVSPAGAV
jgi:hypothetical protein